MVLPSFLSFFLAANVWTRSHDVIKNLSPFFSPLLHSCLLYTHSFHALYKDVQDIRDKLAELRLERFVKMTGIGRLLMGTGGSEADGELVEEEEELREDEEEGYHSADEESVEEQQSGYRVEHSGEGEEVVEEDEEV